MTRVEREIAEMLQAAGHRHGFTIERLITGDVSTDRLRATIRTADGRRLRFDIAEADHDVSGQPGRYWYGLLFPDDPRGAFYIGYHCHRELEQPEAGDLPHRVVRIDGVRAHWRAEARRLDLAAAIEALLDDLEDREGYAAKERLTPQPGETWRAFRRRKIAAARAA